METRRLGSISYEQAWQLQQQLIEQRAENKLSDTVLLLEHPHVITYGKRSPEKDATPQSIQGVPTFAVERGGESTYHGPGQLVAYPIFLIPERMGPKAFLRVLENVIISVLAHYQIPAFAIREKTGVWIHDASGAEKKIASLGIALRRNVSYHGLALNVNPELRYFGLINPCGFSPSVMTSMSQVLGENTPALADVGERLAIELQKTFEEQVRAHYSS